MDKFKKRVDLLASLFIPIRLKILEELLIRDTCVCKLVEKFAIKHSLISYHLKILQNLNYVESKKAGKHIIYSLNKDKVESITSILNFINI